MSTRKLVLITGIPGTGKTSIGNLLEEKYGYKHINFEDGASLNLFAQNPDEFLRSNSTLKDVVITWGFVPVEIQINYVQYLKQQGFKLFWFDGNRVAAFREYLNAGRPENLFFLQMQRICDSDVINLIKPTIINTFDKDGRFRKRSEVIEEIEDCIQ